MQIKSIRKLTEADKPLVSTGCGSTPGDGLDKPPC